MTKISKEIWGFLLQNMIMITAEYLPGILNKEADWESRNVRDFSEWKLKPQIFMNLCKIVGSPTIDLFASRLSNQIPVYFSWKPDPYCLGVDAMQQEWPHNQILYAPPPLFHDQQGFKESSTGSSLNIDSNCSHLAKSGLVPSTDKAVQEKSDIATSGNGLVERGTKEKSPAFREQNINISGLDSFRESLLSQGISERASNLITASRRQGTNANYSSAWNK